MVNLQQLLTEQRNPRTTAMDELPTLDMLRLINDEDKSVPLAVGKILPDIARAVDLIAAALGAGGRLFYLGAGTSGRLGILDAVECPPTFHTDPTQIVGLIAGGTPAIFRAQEGAEDNEALGEENLRAHKFSSRDVLCGIAASGRTPYVIGGLKYAQHLGAKTLALACTSPAEISRYADLSLLPLTGPEVIQGSTRMKAGTAEKLVLNMLSTGAMIRLGKTYHGLMVDVKATNEKLRERAVRIVREISGASREDAEAALREADDSVKLAALRLLTSESLAACQALLEKNRGRLAPCLKAKLQRENE